MHVRVSVPVDWCHQLLRLLLHQEYNHKNTSTTEHAKEHQPNGMIDRNEYYVHIHTCIHIHV